MARRILLIDDVTSEQLGQAPATESAGAADAARVVALGEDGKIHQSMLPAVISGAADSYYPHIQAVPSDTWVVQHALNKYPAVSIVDSSGNRWSADVHYDSPNQLTIYFAFAMGGTAYCS